MIDSKLPNTAISIFSVMSALAHENQAINLSQGFPNFNIDEKLKDCVKKALDDEIVQYAPMPGRLDLREELAKKAYEQHEVTLNPDTEITISAGATQAIYSAIAAVVSIGDEVILFDPAYDCYDPSIRLHGGIPIHLNLTFPEYKIDWSNVNAKISDKTKMIIVNNPQNPSGSVWDNSDLIELEKLCQKFPNLLVLSDEVYEHIQFEGQHQSVLKNDFLRERSFVTYSFGKTFHVTGWKIGYCIAPPALTAELRKMHQYNVFCVNNTIQSALANYLNQDKKWQDVLPLYSSKRNQFMSGMERSKFKPLNCDGTYFCLYNYSAISDESDVDFTKRMTIENKVAAIPVSVFYKDKTDNKVIRFCFAKTEETINEAILKLCKI